MCVGHTRCMSIYVFKEKTAYDMRISDWSSDVCSSDLHCAAVRTSRCRSPVPATADHWTVICSVSFQIPRILSVWNVAACDARQNGRTGERLDVVTARVETHASEQMPLT